jgi:hypothetical protein
MCNPQRQGWLAASLLLLPACTRGSPPANASSSASSIRRPAAGTTDSTFDTTVVQDVRGERRFTYTVRPGGPSFTVVLRGDSGDNQVAELLLLRPGQKVPVQRIEAMPEAPPRGQRDIVFEDVNQDGYADLKLLGSWGTGGLTWWIWYFDPHADSLVPDSSAAHPVM